jgi:hypothetical protein
LFALYDADNDQSLSLEEYSLFYCEVISNAAEVGDCTVWSTGLHHAYDYDQDD